MKEQNNPLVERKMNKLISDTLHLLYLQLGEDSLNISGLVRTALTEAYEAGRKSEQERILDLLDKDNIEYCRQQNGLSSCKNCGLDVEDLRIILNS